MIGLLPTAAKDETPFWETARDWLLGVPLKIAAPTAQNRPGEPARSAPTATAWMSR